MNLVAPGVVDRAAGALLGLAVGDALGTTLEFSAPGTFEPIDDMMGGGPFGLEPGQWTDDTSMALCLAESLVECNGFDAQDQMSRYLRWYREGYWSCTGRCFDIGITTRVALERFEATGSPYVGSTDPHAAGNGSLMRLAPISLWYHRQPRQAIAYAASMSRTTHGAVEAVGAAEYFSGLLVGAMQGVAKELLLSPCFHPCDVPWNWGEPGMRVRQVAGGSFKKKRPPEIRATGYVIDALEAALWAFHSSESFERGALLAVNLGDDADTVGAIYGQIAGAYYGEQGIPIRWRQRIQWMDPMRDLAHRLVVANAYDRVV